MWERSEAGINPDQELCRLGDHTWVASFFESGHLAYWQCAGCGTIERETSSEGLPKRLELFNGWVTAPPRLIARGLTPLVSARRWLTAEGSILIEGDPSSIHFVGEVIPGLPEAHAYVVCDENGRIEARYEPGRESLGKSGDHYRLTRFQVIDDALVRFESRCYEESTYDVPSADKPKLTTMLSGLRTVSVE